MTASLARSEPPEEAELGLRERKKRQTRAALVRAALELVAERGLDAVTVDDICRVADVSPRTFFNYFTSKEGALTGQGDPIGARISARVDAAPADRGGLEALREALRAEAELIQADRDLWMLRMSVITANPTLLLQLVTGSAHDEQALVDVLSRRTGDGSMFPLLLASTAGAAFRTAMRRWCEQSGSRPLSDLIDDAFDLLAAGLPDPRPAAPH